MCGMSQFEVVITIPDETSIILARNFIQHILIKFGLCHLIALDDGTLFKGYFITMCQALNSNYNILAKQKYKGLTVGEFRRLLNRALPLQLRNVILMTSLFLLASLLAMLGIVHRLMVPIFFAAFRLSAGNYTFPLTLIFMLSQR